MSESVIQIDEISPLEIYGVGDKYLNIIKDLFPKLKIWMLLKSKVNLFGNKYSQKKWIQI